MAASSTMSKTLHNRSVSLPSTLHPIVAHFYEVLCRLKSSEAASSSSICTALNGIRDLNECVDDLLLMPEYQQALTQEDNEKHSNEVLDGSLRLLDVCGVAMDSLLQAKESTQELQSILRRKVGETSVAKEVGDYMTRRRKATKALRNLKALQYIGKDDATTTSIFSMLKEVEAITITVLGSLLTFISGSKRQSVPCKWSLVSKLMQSKRINCEEPIATEFTMVESALQTLTSQKTINPMQMQDIRNRLADLDLSNQDLEEGVESLFRRLIKTRVSLLNILNH